MKTLLGFWVLAAGYGVMFAYAPIEMTIIVLGLLKTLGILGACGTVLGILWLAWALLQEVNR